MKLRPEKNCATCGRRIVWRAKWRDCWDEVKNCSERCRRNKPGATGDAAEHAILDLLSTRKTGATICPSEVARMLHPDVWRDHMEEIRNAARRLVVRGRIEIIQRGRAVDPSTAKGPIRLRLVGS
ncbi:MAG: DUF3253 domain-containing protein [Luteolibacter sp.]